MSMNILFWICWTAELGVVLWWIFTELQLEYLEPNMYSFLALGYLLLILLIRFQSGGKKIAMIMTGLPAIPLAGMLFIIVIHSLSGGKWN